jgi:hypothetical protein
MGKNISPHRYKGWVLKVNKKMAIGEKKSAHVVVLKYTLPSRVHSMFAQII